MTKAHAPSTDASSAGDLAPAKAGDDIPASRGHRGFRLGLHAFALLLTAWTFVLLAVGGTVTSNGYGLAIPDWPGTDGYALFLAPVDKWIRDPETGAFMHGPFWEHFHRLNGMAVGLIAIGLAIWLWRTQRHRDWLRWLGLVLLGGVIIQGLMGGFRVADTSQFLAGVHGVFGQLFFGGVVLAAAATGRVWTRGLTPGFHAPTPPRRGYWIELVIMSVALAAGILAAIFLGNRNDTATNMTWTLPEVGDVLVPAVAIFVLIPTVHLVLGLRRVWKGRRVRRGKGWSWPAIASVALVVALAIQLVLGAAVRHDAGAARAIPDAPLVFGHIAPPGSPPQLEAEIAAMPPDLRPPPTTTLAQVHLHYTHRVWALVVTAIALWVGIALWRARMLGALTIGPLMLMYALIGLQIMLGVMTVWSGIYPTMATMHQANGAALLGVCVWLAVRVHLARRITEQRAIEAEPQAPPAASRAAPSTPAAGAPA